MLLCLLSLGLFIAWLLLIATTRPVLEFIQLAHILKYPVKLLMWGQEISQN